MTLFRYLSFCCHCQRNSRCTSLVLSCIYTSSSASHFASVRVLQLGGSNLFSSSVSEVVSMGGTLEYLASLFTGGGGGDHHGHKNSRRRQLQTVELKVRMDCEGCELKVKNALSSMKGVESVKINRKQQKVTVSGYVEAGKVLKKAQSTRKKSELWPYVPYGAASHPYPYVAAAYDRRAPPGHVRNVEASSAAYVQSGAGGSRAVERLTNLFNDEDPNACVVM
ncbi:heavy metal-associated isoprenylated plant protein 23-like isoform X1 [Oryza brachyantha]|uniref:heavy metal-associated isoprenylated plant protein 23-like isoform X1 n=1 Tax=Oryza brachyantha TaxID=4533 RepID=UPI000776630D|nr:heavy metal-associated isoprenylated plant protein 23-like isoform X1 [Oryza brachyantha]